MDHGIRLNESAVQNRMRTALRMVSAVVAVILLVIIPKKSVRTAIPLPASPKMVWSVLTDEQSAAELKIVK